MKKPFKVGVFILIPIMIFSLFLNWYFYKSNEMLEVEVQKNHAYLVKEERLCCMTKTLGIAYGISKWEGYYYSIIFDDFATKNNIPWEIYAAIVRIESNYNATVVSPKGAKGMMQIMESTGESVAKKLGINFVKTQTLWNDFINMILGCTYLSDNILSSGLENGVKCYMGGPGCLVTIKDPSSDAHQYISAYKTSVWKEYKEMVYIHRGVVNESNKFSYEEIHRYSYPDSVIPVQTHYRDTTSTKSKIKPVRKNTALNL